MAALMEGRNATASVFVVIVVVVLAVIGWSYGWFGGGTAVTPPEATTSEPAPAAPATTPQTPSGQTEPSQ